MVLPLTQVIVTAFDFAVLEELAMGVGVDFAVKVGAELAAALALGVTKTELVGEGEATGGD